jgi:hypothetical protein
MWFELEWSMASPTIAEPDWRDALSSSVAALRRVAGYSLDSALDRRILELGERKEFLSPSEQAELLAWIAFTQERSLEKLEAERALRRLLAICPELDNVP